MSEIEDIKKYLLSRNEKIETVFDKSVDEFFKHSLERAFDVKVDCDLYKGN